jgi:hypothetical protein
VLRREYEGTSKDVSVLDFSFQIFVPWWLIAFDFTFCNNKNKKIQTMHHEALRYTDNTKKTKKLSFT